MRTQNFIRSMFLAAALAAGSVLAADAPETTHDGLQRVEAKNADLLYTRPGATLAGYKRVALLDCYVAFKKNWQREQNETGLRVSSADMDRIKKNLAAEFRKVFTDELAEGGYALTTESGEDVLIIRPAIIDLDVAAPDVMTAGRSRTFSTSAGGMTLYVELFDGATGEILARAVDRAQARDTGFMTWQSSVTNRAEADRMLKKWAGLARAALDRAHGSTPPAAAN